MISFVAQRKRGPRGNIHSVIRLLGGDGAGYQTQVSIIPNPISHSPRKRKKHTVDVHLRVTNNLLDLSLLLKVSKGLAGQAAVDLETVDQSGDSDQTVGLDILVETLSGLLLEDDGVLGLVLDYIRRKNRCQ